MKITINIEERIGTAIREFCKANNLKQNQYLVDIIEKQFNLDRYGDMNEMLKKKTVKKTEMKLVDEKPKEEKPVKETVSEINTVDEKMALPQTKPTKRTLKTK